MERLNPKIDKGLTDKEVEERIKEGLVHKDISVPTKSIKQIISGNFFTLFNILNLALALAVFLVGAYKNMLFVGTAFFNMIISIIQEIRAKKIVDKLTLLKEDKIEVLRNGKVKKIDKEEIVLDDLIILKNGSSVVVDSIIMDNEVMVNESFITGESKPILKKKGDMILSGSFIISGCCTCKVEHIGKNNYTSIISRDAKYLKKPNSVLMESLDKIIKYISIVIVPVGILLFINQMGVKDNNITSAVINTVAALIGMIPDGLVLLTSTVLAVSVIRLGKYNVLVQELYCIETLARTDVLCLDKTGTITEGIMEVKDIIKEASTDDINTVMSDMCYLLDDISPTMEALRKYYEKNKSKIKNKKEWKISPFSSETKYSSIKKDNVMYYLGAPDFIMKEKCPKEYDKYSKEYRTLLLAKEKNGQKEIMALFLLQDKIRKEAKSTLEYFKKENVDIKIISGDNPITVSQIGKRVGLDNYDKYVDLSKIKSDKELKEALINNTIFGRVKPEEKRKIVIMLKKLGHTVAMTGDGVNDVLALKEADCSIAMINGSDAARNVSQIVLMDSNFDSMPKVVLEGRRTINNIQRSASLFLTKTIYTSLMVIFLLFFHFMYPFRPIELTLMNFVTIGAPALVLALEPNNDRVKGGFLVNVVANALPTALAVFISLVAIIIVGNTYHFTPDEMSTMAVLVTTIIMLIYQAKLCIPFNAIRTAMYTVMCLMFSLAIVFFRDFFMMTLLSVKALIAFIIILTVGILLWFFFNKILNKNKEKLEKFL